MNLRFGSSLNAHLHFHCVVIDGVFDAAAAGGVIFTAATGVEATAIAQAQVRQRLLRVFVRRGLLPRDDARAMGQWQHGSGFSVDGSVRIEAADRAGRERLLRYCARPPFALDRLRELDPERLLYESTKPGPGRNASLRLMPLELIDRLGAAAARPPSPLLRRVDANGRSREISTATSTGRNWPKAVYHPRPLSTLHGGSIGQEADTQGRGFRSIDNCPIRAPIARGQDHRDPKRLFNLS